MEGPIVQTAEGKLRGCIKKNLDGEEFYSFLGVRYAKPPVGELRFKDPQPLEHWNGVKDATEEGQRFYQKDNLTTMTKIESGTEDGLHLNVFTKKPIPQGSKLNPVMVWIHGGGFREGFNNTNMYGPEFLMLENVVLISVNYRLGLLGALQLEDPSLEVFGNAGLKDQVAALKWVQKNIQNFGGDPNNVTIFGESAGAASVHFLVISPAAKGLFHRAIMQSGSALNPWAMGYPFLDSILAANGKTGLSEKEVLEYLRSLSLEELYAIQEKETDLFRGSFSPVVENPNPNAFITKQPIEYITSGEYNKVPMMIGYCSLELLFFKGICTQEKVAEILQKYNYEYWTSSLLHAEKDSEIVKKLSAKLKDFYDNAESELQCISDAFMTMQIIGAAINHAKTSDKPVYLYRVSIDSGRNYVKRTRKIEDKGVSHLDDVGYLFKTTLPLPKKDSPEDAYVRRFVKLWTNFARHGNPTPKNSDLEVTWKPVDEKSVNFLDIDKKLTVEINPENDRVKIWRELYQANPSTAKIL